ncbi:MAG: PDZ domain-containing protein [Leptospirales bacterium]|nr:PDZ domain-containing protein [Leptospirales bacterium]
MMLRTLRAIAILTLTLFVLCKQSGPAPLDAARALAQTEEAIRQHYFFPEGQGWTFASLYTAAARAVDGTRGESIADREALLHLLQSLPADRQREATLHALEAMMAALPKGYNLCTRPENRALETDPARRAGVGLVLHMNAPGKIRIVDVLEGSPAYRESVEVGAYLQSIEGQSIEGLSVSDAAGRIRGEPGERVRIDLSSGKSYNLERGEVHFRNILNSSWKLASGGAAEYVMLRAASGDAPEQLRSLFARIGQREAIILDLRRMFNGDYDRVFAIANLFANSGPLGALRYRSQEEAEYVSDVDRIYSGPLYVLLGDESSPYAEVMAAALAPAPNVEILGHNARGEAFLSYEEQIDGGAVLTITAGVVLGPDNQPLYEAPPKVDEESPAPLPQHAPLEFPDREDPLQMILARKLRAVLG